MSTNGAISRLSARTCQEIDARVREMSDGELELNSTLNHMERMPGVYGDLPAVNAMLTYETEAIRTEQRRRQRPS